MQRKCNSISTHTLTWSVTERTLSDKATLRISTHTLTWSVTICKDKSSMTENFNSHAHVERDLGTQYGLIREFNFNSHAHVERDRICMQKMS